MRTRLDITIAPGCAPQGSRRVRWQAADAKNGNEFGMATTSSSYLVMARNKGSRPQTITLYSAPDSRGRTDDFTEELLPGSVVLCFGPYGTGDHFRQPDDGSMHIDASSPDVEISVVQVTGLEWA